MPACLIFVIRHEQFEHWGSKSQTNHYKLNCDEYQNGPWWTVKYKLKVTVNSLLLKSLETKAPYYCLHCILILRRSPPAYFSWWLEVQMPVNSKTQQVCCNMTRKFPIEFRQSARSRLRLGLLKQLLAPSLVLNCPETVRIPWQQYETAAHCFVVFQRWFRHWCCMMKHSINISGGRFSTHSIKWLLKEILSIATSIGRENLQIIMHLRLLHLQTSKVLKVAVLDNMSKITLTC